MNDLHIHFRSEGKATSKLIVMELEQKVCCIFSSPYTVCWLEKIDKFYFIFLPSSLLLLHTLSMHTNNIKRLMNSVRQMLLGV